jgi:hypothetical protein
MATRYCTQHPLEGVGELSPGINVPRRKALTTVDRLLLLQDLQILLPQDVYVTAEEAHPELTLLVLPNLSELSRVSYGR